jgi:hypothetical protein
MQFNYKFIKNLSTHSRYLDVRISLIEIRYNVKQTLPHKLRCYFLKSAKVENQTRDTSSVLLSCLNSQQHL